jgi:hypothetical protein
MIFDATPLPMLRFAMPFFDDTPCRRISPFFAFAIAIIFAISAIAVIISYAYDRLFSFHY